MNKHRALLKAETATRVWFSVAVLLYCVSFRSALADTAANSWLLGYSGRSTNAVIWNAKFKTLLNEVVPKICIDIGTGASVTLGESVKEFFSGPPEDVLISNQRFVVLSACRAASCTEKAWLWLDLKSGETVGALVHYVFKGEFEKSPSLLLFSRTTDATQLPVECKSEIKKWLGRHGIVPRTTRFAGEIGEIRAIPQPFTD